MSMIFQRVLLLMGLLQWLAGGTVAAQIPGGVDMDRDGVPDHAPDHVLVVLKYGINPGAGNPGICGEGQRPEQLMDKSRAAGGADLARRLASRGDVGNLLQLTPAGKRGKALANVQRHLLKVRFEGRAADLSQFMQELSEDPAVESVEPDYAHQIELNDPFLASSGAWGQTYRDQWYAERISAPATWDLLAPDAGNRVIIAVIDTGIDRTHPDLTGVVWSNPGEIASNGIDDDGNGYIDDTHGWNFAKSNNDTGDSHGHGTFIAGEIGATQDNGFGIAGMVPGARIMALRNTETGTSYSSHSIQALYYAVNNGARVVNMSFGGTHYSHAFAQAIRYAVDNDVVLVASSGNAGLESYTHYPSSYDGVISVGASDHLDQRAQFSNYGTGVDLLAPGGGGTAYSGRTMMSCRASGTAMGDVVDAYHVRSSGTSFAAPLVSAAAALLLDARPTLNAYEVKRLLLDTADELGAPGWDLQSSSGRLNLLRAMGHEVPRDLFAEITSPVNDQCIGKQLVNVSGSARGEQVTGYLLDYGSGKEPTAWQVIQSSGALVDRGVLGVFDARGLASGYYTLRLRLQSGAIVVATERVLVYVGGSSPPTKSGWSRPTLVNVTGVTVIDLDGDGGKESLISTGNGVFAYRPNGSAFGPGIYAGSLKWCQGPASVGDIDHDGELEIGLMTKSGTSTVYPEAQEIRFWNLDGTTCPGWPISLLRDNNYVPSSLAPTVVDIDGDGAAEVAYPDVDPSDDKPRLNLVNGQGVALPGWPVKLQAPSGAWTHCTVAAADLDGDGTIDFALSDSSGKVHAYNHAGQLLRGWPVQVNSGSSIFHEIVVTDLDRDGQMELIVTFYNGLVSVLTHDGKTKAGWPQNLGSIPRAPAIADMDGDGDLEIAIGTQVGMVWLKQHDGNNLPGWPQSVPSRSYTPCLVDLNNDNRLDVVAADGALTLHAWEADGAQLSQFGFPFRLPGTFGCYTMPVVEDLEGDGLLDLIVYGDNLECRQLTAKANPRVLPFSHVHCDPANTCRYVVPGTIRKGQRFLSNSAGGDIINLDGLGLMAGSTVQIGFQSAAVSQVEGGSMQIEVPSGLPFGWHDIWITHSNSEPIWLANAVLVVQDIYGDSDLDGLSDFWEFKHRLNPLVHDAADSPGGINGDPDGDGVSNLFEEVFAKLNMSPAVADADLLPRPQISNGRLDLAFPLDPSSMVDLVLQWSPDMEHWYSPGDAEFPAGIVTTDGAVVDGMRTRHIGGVLPDGRAGYFRFNASR